MSKEPELLVRIVCHAARGVLVVLALLTFPFWIPFYLVGIAYEHFENQIG